MTRIEENKSLVTYNSFGIDVKAKRFVNITNEAELITVLKENSGPYFLLSGGSNMLLTKDIDALVIHINNKGVSHKVLNDEEVLVSVKAGENWSELVQYCIDQKWGGIENLSLIPGKAGSAPIQNIGAYGVELKDVLVSVDTIEIDTKKTITFSNQDCQFGYRESIFKNASKNQFIITEIHLKLRYQNHEIKSEYGTIREELNAMKIKSPSIADIGNAVCTIRKRKLPDPKVIGNSGSFFKNPIIKKDKLIELQAKFPEIPYYTIDANYVKLPAGWLIDKAGLKGYTKGNAAVHDKQALVLINKTGNANGHEIADLAEIIKEKIKEIYTINLEREVNLF